MKAPSQTDAIVKVNAYLSDREFGYDRWMADQFGPFGMPVSRMRRAVLCLCEDDADRDALIQHLETLRAATATTQEP